MKYIAGLEVGTQINDFEKLFEGIINGFRAQPWNIPGTTYSHAVKVFQYYSLYLYLVKKSFHFCIITQNYFINSYFIVVRGKENTQKKNLSGLE